jgi:DNA-binding transcriptional regulator YdaS (Cro superfamily)
MSATLDLDQFNALVDRFAQVHGWINQAVALAPQYSAIVVERVVRGHSATREELAVQIVPLMMEVEEHASHANRQRDEVDARVAAARAALDELNLRHMIGELDDDALAEASGEHQATIDGVSDLLAAAEASAATWRGALARWEILGREAGVLQ